MKYIFLAASIIFGLCGIAQAMELFGETDAAVSGVEPVVYKLQTIVISVTPAPGFVNVMILSVGFFLLHLIWKKLKELGIGSLSEYVLE